MREFKFRAWVETFSGGMMLRNVDNIWWYNGEVERIHGCDNLHNFKFKHDEEPITLLQYTGLKDKNGVEIYEGDVVVSNTVGRLAAIVEWAGTGFITKPINPRADYPTFMYGDLEVIGNIYENPELIND